MPMKKVDLSLSRSFKECAGSRQAFTILEATVALGLTGVLGMGALAVLSSGKSLDEANKSDADLSDLYTQMVAILSDPAKCAIAFGDGVTHPQAVASTTAGTDVTLYDPVSGGKFLYKNQKIGRWKVTQLNVAASFGGAYGRPDGTNTTAFSVTLTLSVVRVAGPVAVIGSQNRERTLRLVLQTGANTYVTGCGLSDPYATAIIPLPTCASGYILGYNPGGGYWECSMTQGYYSPGE